MIRLATADAVSATYGVVRLPASFVVDPDLRLRLRMDGPRDWSSPTSG